MEQMESKLQAFLAQTVLGLQKIDTFIKRHYLNTVIKQFLDFPIKLYKYSGRQSQQKTQWFLRADTFTPDLTKNILNQDTEVKIKHSGFTHPKIEVSTRPQSQRGSVKFPSSSFSHSRRSIPRKSSQSKETYDRQVLMPLENNEIDSDSQLSQSSEAINNFRQQKTRRQEYKNKLMRAERAEIFKLINKSLTGFVLNPAARLSKKKEKIQQVNHYIPMDVTVREPENIKHEKLKKFPVNTTHSLHSKTERAAKNQTLNLFSNSKYEGLKPDEKVYLLNVPNQLKLSPGVTFRDNQKNTHTQESTALFGATRKKLQFLKNEQMNPLRIKMAELMSFKKISTSNNIAYCSSMKTLKDIPKDGTQSKISIDSKQFLDEPSGSKKLIKIANRRIYEQLIIDINEDGSQPHLKKGKFKSKRQVKVRFDNMEAA